MLRDKNHDNRFRLQNILNNDGFFLRVYKSKKLEIFNKRLTQLPVT